jgi:phytoene desaturase
MANDNGIIIIGGGLAGLSTGCYARMNGWRTLVIEHGQQLGGVCSAWRRDAYLIDGCIQWLMGTAEGGAFRRVYEELGIIGQVPLEPLEVFERYEDVDEGIAVDITSDLDALRTQLIELAPDDRGEIARLIEAARKTAELPLAVDRPPELRGIGDRLRQAWDLRHIATTAVRFRGSIGEWADKHLRTPRLRELVRRLLHPDMPMLILPALLGQLAHGQLSRPRGGSAAFRDAIERRYRELGGEAWLETTVEEILVEDGRAVGVRLADGSILRADLVVSTSSLDETAYRLLGGRFLDDELRERLVTWPRFEPIVLISLGVERDLSDAPPALLLRQSKALPIDDRAHDTMYVRIFNDDPSFAPAGHTVVQATIGTTYAWWATRGDRYQGEKDAAVDSVIGRLDRRFPGLRDGVRMRDMSTPLSYWRHARSWRGAYEGWLPTVATFRTHVPKTWPGVQNLYLAGQWVEPGGGVPIALMSGRQLVQILCDQTGRGFTAAGPQAMPRAA